MLDKLKLKCILFGHDISKEAKDLVEEKVVIVTSCQRCFKTLTLVKGGSIIQD